MRRNFYVITALLLLLAMVALSHFMKSGRAVVERLAARKPIHAVFGCDGGRTIDAVFRRVPADSVDLKFDDGRAVTLPRALSADGARYAAPDGGLVFWNKGRKALLTGKDFSSYTNCAAAE